MIINLHLLINLISALIYSLYKCISNLNFIFYLFFACSDSTTGRTYASDTCVGLSKRYQVCNDLPCETDDYDIRAYQCATYDKVDFQGEQYSWEPYIKGMHAYDIKYDKENLFDLLTNILSSFISLKTMLSVNWTANRWAWNTLPRWTIPLLMEHLANVRRNIIDPSPLTRAVQCVSTAFARWMLAKTQLNSVRLWVHSHHSHR